MAYNHHVPIETLDAFLLTRSWHDHRDGLRLVFWCASERGPVRLRLTQQEAVMFVERHIPSEAGRRKPLELTSFFGRPVDALYFDTQRELARERERIRDTLGWTLEGDIKPDERFLMERFVTGALRVRGEARERCGVLEFENPKVEASDYSPRLSMLAFDLETDGFDGPLLSIAAAGAGGERVWMRDDTGHRDRVSRVGEGPGQLTYLPDEAALLRAFIAHVTAVDPDVLCGWNVVEFDLSYLERRCAQLGVPLTLGRDGQRAKVLPARNEQQPPIARVEGRVVLDGIATLRSATFSFESFRLEDVAQELLGRGKKIHHDGDALTEIRRLFAEDKPALAAYNLEDCRLVLGIFAAADLLGFAVQRQALTGLPLGRQGGSVAAFDYLYLPRLHRHGHVAPDVGRAGDAESSPGGYVMDSEPGLFDNVLVLDFKSLYPSIIRTFAIDPMGLAFPGDDPLPGFEGGSFARSRHILPEIIETLWAARDEAKVRGDAARSRVIKILMNSFYGVLGTPGCRFFSPKLASSITCRGHEIITESRSFIEARGLRVIYGDTDSLFVLLGPGPDEAACRSAGTELAAALNDFWRTKLRRELRLESHLEVQYETHYLRFLMPTMRGSDKGSKKRYAGLSRRRDGELGVVVKGLEAVRTDWTPLARRFQRELFHRVFVDAPFHDWMRELAASVRAGELDAELVYKKRLRRKVEQYEKNVPPHVQAAKKLGRPVREVHYVMTVRGPEPTELPHAALDYDHYLDRQLAPAADAILPFLGTDFASIAGTQLQLF
ncbi:MAG: DNA polymerase II [Myxococcales bacterium]|nr:DNA polymerase II [Myxococcales bacterium]